MGGSVSIGKKPRIVVPLLPRPLLESNQQRFSLTRIGDHLWGQIFTYLPCTPLLGQCYRVCRWWHTLVQLPSSWYRLAIWPRPLPTVAAPPPHQRDSVIIVGNQTDVDKLKQLIPNVITGVHWFVLHIKNELRVPYFCFVSSLIPSAIPPTITPHEVPSNDKKKQKKKKKNKKDDNKDNGTASVQWQRYELYMDVYRAWYMPRSAPFLRTLIVQCRIRAKVPVELPNDSLQIRSLHLAGLELHTLVMPPSLEQLYINQCPTPGPLDLRPCASSLYALRIVNSRDTTFHLLIPKRLSKDTILFPSLRVFVWPGVLTLSAAAIVASCAQLQQLLIGIDSKAYLSNLDDIDHDLVKDITHIKDDELDDALAIVDSRTIRQQLVQWPLLKNGAVLIMFPCFFPNNSDQLLLSPLSLQTSSTCIVPMQRWMNLLESRPIFQVSFQVDQSHQLSALAQQLQMLPSLTSSPPPLTAPRPPVDWHDVVACAFITSTSIALVPHAWAKRIPNAVSQKRFHGVSRNMKAIAANVIVRSSFIASLLVRHTIVTFDHAYDDEKSVIAPGFGTTERASSSPYIPAALSPRWYVANGECADVATCLCGMITLSNDETVRIKSLHGMLSGQQVQFIDNDFSLLAQWLPPWAVSFIMSSDDEKDDKTRIDNNDRNGTDTQTTTSAPSTIPPTITLPQAPIVSRGFDLLSSTTPTTSPIEEPITTSSTLGAATASSTSEVSSTHE
jgi:hypothetical protein